MTAIQFQKLAGRLLEEQWGLCLSQGEVRLGSIRKAFDYVSKDRSVVGDAKFYGDCRSPSGKMATISEYVFLLQKCNASHRFILFGNDRAIPERWLRRYGSLLDGIRFYFLGPNGLEVLN